MQNEIHDEKPVPGNDAAAATPEENISSEKTDETEEQDLDDLVHNNLVEEIPLNEEIDPDDVVHHAATVPNLDPDAEKDPDDLVHGN